MCSKSISWELLNISLRSELIRQLGSEWYHGCRKQIWNHEGLGSFNEKAGVVYLFQAMRFLG